MRGFDAPKRESPAVENPSNVAPSRAVHFQKETDRLDEASRDAADVILRSGVRMFERYGTHQNTNTCDCKLN